MLLASCKVEFSPAGWTARTIGTRTANSHALFVTNYIGDLTPTRLPGRPTPRFFSFLFDDTVRLLNPKTMGSYQVTRKKEFGPIFKTTIFFRPTVFVTDELSLRQLASEEAIKDLEAYFPPHHQLLFGKQSLLIQSGETHARLRRLIQPSLSPATIQSFEGIVNESVERFLNNLQQTVTQDYEAMVPKLRSFFVALTLQVVLGTSDEPAADLARDIELWAEGLLAPPLTFVPWSKAAKAIRARKRIMDRLAAMMKAQKEEPKYGLLGKLMAARGDAGDALSQEDIVDNVLTILFAGSDTTASATISLWKVLSLNPKLKSALRNAPSKTLERLLDTILQTYPPAPFSMRKTRQELALGEYTVPSNWLVVYGFAGVLSGMGSSDKLDSDIPAWVVDTAASELNSKSPLSSIAFGAGPRKCPGRFLASLELMTFVKNLVDMDWELKPDQNLEQRYTPGFFPVDGLKIKFPRKDSA